MEDVAFTSYATDKARKSFLRLQEKRAAKVKKKQELNFRESELTRLTAENQALKKELALERLEKKLKADGNGGIGEK